MQDGLVPRVFLWGNTHLTADCQVVNPPGGIRAVGAETSWRRTVTACLLRKVFNTVFFSQASIKLKQKSPINSSVIGDF